MKVKEKTAFFRVIFRVIFTPKRGFKMPKMAFAKKFLKTPRTLVNKGKIQYLQGFLRVDQTGVEPVSKNQFPVLLLS